METRTPVEILRDMIGMNERTIADLEARHGTGVRSAWVGEEIGIHHYRIEHLKRQLLEVGDTQ
jgi:hypothetical protein